MITRYRTTVPAYEMKASKRRKRLRPVEPAPVAATPDPAPMDDRLAAGTERRQRRMGRLDGVLVVRLMDDGLI